MTFWVENRRAIFVPRAVHCDLEDCGETIAFLRRRFVGKPIFVLREIPDLDLPCLPDEVDSCDCPGDRSDSAI
jgi:hypothetical protein